MQNLRYHIFAYWHDNRWEKFVGATVKILDLTKNLANQGNDVTLFLPKLRFGNTFEKFKIVEIPFINFPFLRRISFNLFLLLYLFRFCFRNRPHVIYTRRMGSIIPGIYAKFVKAIFLYEVNDDPYRKDFHGGSIVGFHIRKFLSEWLDEINLNLCHRAFIIANELKNKIKKQNPSLSEDKFVEMHSGANIELFKPLDRLKCRAYLGLDLNKKYIGFVGTLLNHQGIDILINAASLILKRESSSIFFIIGEGPMKKIWIDCVRKKGLKDSFIFTGQIEYEIVPTWIGASDICVAPFKKNAGYRSPVKIFDYLACARPVVASTIKGTTDVFKGTGAIKIITPEDPNILSDTIIDLLHDEKLANKMGQKGREFVVSKYDRKKLSQMVIKAALDNILTQ